MRTKCKTRVERHVSISPLTEYMAEGDLMVYESTGKLKRGKSQFVAIYNPTSKEIFLKKGTVVGNVIEVNTLIQFPLLSEIGKMEINSVGVEETKVEKPWHEQIDLSHLNVKERKQVQKLLMEEKEVFSKHKNDIGHIRDFKMRINLVDNTPVSESYRQRFLYDVKNHINNLLAHGWVKRSSSSYASPIVCVRKKDGRLRLCVDFRKLNAKTISDKQPIPRVQDILDGLGGQEWLTCRKRINDCLYNLRDKICVAYLVDILIYGKTFKEHEQNVKIVLRCLKEKGINLNPKKCQFFKKEIRYLG